MNLEKLKDAARKFEQKEDWRRAIEVYQKAIVEFESGHDPNPDLSIYNRVGDLHMKANNPAAAVTAYERAVDLYSDQGFLNNAVALCGKILRVNPGRIQAYLKLAQLHARKNVVVDAKKNLIEYLERMNQVHQLDEAFKAVKAFADQFPGNQEIRLMLSDLLRASSRTTEAREQLQKLTAVLEAKGDTIGARKTRERLQAIAEIDETSAPAPRKNDLVFLDIGVEVRAPRAATPSIPVAPPRRSTVRTPRPTVRTTPVLPPETLIDDTLIVTPPPTTDDMSETDLMDGAPLEIETSSLVDSELDLDPAASPPPVADLLRPDDAIEPLDEMEDLEPTILEGGPEVEIGPMDGLVLDRESVPIIDEPVSLIDDHLHVDPGEVEPLEGMEPEFAAATPAGLAEDDRLTIDEAGEDESLPLIQEEILIEASESSGEILDDGTDWDIPEEAVAPSGSGLPAIEQPDDISADPLDWDLPDEPVAAAATEPAPPDGSPEAALSFLQVDEPVQPSIEELEDRILDDPDNPENHRALGETLLASGDAVRGVDELDLALLGYENREDWEHALDLINELIRIDPGSVRYYQKRVEVAYRTGEKTRLIDAYLELGDALLRSGALDKALAVYRRVIEHEPENPRARSALSVLAPPEPVEATPSTPSAGRTSAPHGAKPEGGDGDFVDLGSLVMEEDPIRNTRMRVEDEEPTGDEERDFKEMLSQFKRGIEQNVDAEDFQSHYDLGVAFKEMGLLDEAIAEFQKALRSPEGRLRTSEALGVCFYEKEQFPIAEAILKRAIDSQSGADDQKVGLLYWLGRSLEVQNKIDESLATYRRVLAVDIRFGDAGERMSQLNAGRVG